MKGISKQQIIKIHALLNNTGMMDYKREIIFSFSGIGSDSTKDLTYHEANQSNKDASKKRSV